MHKVILKIVSIITIFLMVLWIPTMHQKKSKEVHGLKKEQVVVKEKEEVMVSVTTAQGSESLPLEEYLLGVVASEMPYHFELEALKAQAVAARTFVLQRDLKVDDTTSSQVYKSSGQLKEIFDEQYDEMIQKVKQAVEETKSQVIQYNGEYISAMFYSSNNGKSNNASWYYKNEMPYLQSVDSKWDLQFEQTKKKESKTKQECIQALQVNELKIGNIEEYENGYVKTIQIDNIVFTGREIREKLKLRSSCFTIQIQNEEVIIDTVGFGHGVGMSQYGAQGMALEGYTYDAILKHYYTGITIDSI